MKNFAGKNLRGKSFKGQNLTGADFSGADIRSANFTGANLTGANFCHARAGLTWFARIVRTTSFIVLGCVAGFLSSITGFLIFVLLQIALKKLIKIDDPSIYFIISIILLTIYFIIIKLFIRKGVFWGGFMAMAWVVAVAAAVAVVGWGAAFAGVMAAMVNIADDGAATVFGLAAVVAVVFAAVATAVTLAAAAASSAAGAAAVFGTAATFGTVAIAVVFVLVVFTFDGVGAATTVIIFLQLGLYIRCCALSEDPQFFLLRRFALWFNALGSTNFQRANLTNTNFPEADLKHASFINAIVTRTNWQGAKYLNWARLNGTILADQAVRELLVRGNARDAIANTWQPSPTAFVGKNLKGAYLVNADLDGVDFTEADFSGADLQGANLRHANLTKAAMLGANLRGADLTGATLDAWNIDSATNLDGAFAEYVYLKANQQERRPQSGVFGDKEFSKLFQEALNTIDFIYKNGIDWQAFMISFDQLREHVRVESDGADISVQSIENKGDGVFVVRVAAPPGVNMAQAHQIGVELYQAQLALQEAKYQALLQGKDEQLAIYREWLNDKRQGDIRMDTILKTLTERSQEQYSQVIQNLNGNVIQGSKEFTTNAEKQSDTSKVSDCFSWKRL